MIENLRKRWTLPTALAFLMWFVFAPQCISTIAITRRETNGWKWPAFMVGYLFVLAYIASGATYWIASAIGLSRHGRRHGRQERKRTSLNPRHHFAPRLQSSD